MLSMVLGVEQLPIGNPLSLTAVMLPELDTLSNGPVMASVIREKADWILAKSGVGMLRLVLLMSKLSPLLLEGLGLGADVGRRLGCAEGLGDMVGEALG